MGIGGAVIYSLIVLAIQEIALAMRWAGCTFVKAAALYASGEYCVPYVDDSELNTSPPKGDAS